MMVVLSPCVFRDFLGSRALLGEERVAFSSARGGGMVSCLLAADALEISATARIFANKIKKIIDDDIFLKEWANFIPLAHSISLKNLIPKHSA